MTLNCDIHPGGEHACIMFDSTADWRRNMTMNMTTLPTCPSGSEALELNMTRIQPRLDFTKKHLIVDVRYTT